MVTGLPPLLLPPILYTQRHSCPRPDFRAGDTWRGNLSPALVSLLQGPQDIWARFLTLSSLCPSVQPPIHRAKLLLCANTGWQEKRALRLPSRAHTWWD